MKKPKLFALLWSLPTPETSKRKLMTINSTKLSLTKSKFGNPWFKWPKDSKPFTKFKFSIATSNARMFFAQKTVNTNSEIWMCPKWPSEEWPEPKLGHLITQVLKSGMTSHMIPNATSGHSDALFMKWLRSTLLSEPIIWNNCIKKSKKVFIPTSLPFTLKILNTLSVNVSRCLQLQDLLQVSFYSIQKLSKTCLPVKLTTRKIIKRARLHFWKQSWFQKIWKI